MLLFCWVAKVNATPATQVALFMKAYNQHNIEKMLEKTSEDVKWLYNIDDTLHIETDGKDALRQAMLSHFKHKTSARSQIKQSMTIGNTVVVIEEAFLSDGINSQCALSIYQLKQNLIKSVTYYEATACNNL